MSFKPLRLTWTLGEMVVQPHPLHLDGLVSYAMLRQAEDIGLLETEAANKTIREYTQGFALPFQRVRRDDLQCWAASALLADEVLENGMRLWTRKVNIYEIADLVAEGTLCLGKRAYDGGVLKPMAGRIDTVRGAYKQWFKYIPTRTVKALHAYCLGDEERLWELLSPEAGYITHLGPRTRMGLGQVTGFTITSDEAAGERWQMRVMPWPIEGAVKAHLAVSPPYWAPENRAPAWVHPAVFA